MADGSYTFAHAVAGGALIGLASFVASGATGKIPGISGVFGRLLTPKPGDIAWRAVFLIGLLVGAAATIALSSGAAIYRPVRGMPVVAMAGLLVGIGTRLGGGCTSGHGVCGMGLGAKDSMVATIIFMAVAMLTVFVARVVGL